MNFNVNNSSMKLRYKELAGQKQQLPVITDTENLYQFKNLNNKIYEQSISRRIKRNSKIEG